MAGSSRLTSAGALPHLSGMQKPVTAYGGNLEDVLLFRALSHIENGFYVDVGANDPVADSVTKLFYDRGWRGINIEPQQQHLASLRKQRPRDVNLGVVASDRTGRITFHQVGGWAHGLSTLRPEVLKSRDLKGEDVRSCEVEARTLTDICAEHAPAEIHFLKIDVEGAEGEVLRGFDLGRFRPWIIVAEAFGPQDWEQDITGRGYDFVHQDPANRYFVSAEHRELSRAFGYPVDNYIRYSRKDVEDALLLRHKPLKWLTKKLFG